MLCWRTSILADTSPARSCSTWLAPAQFHDRLLADPHTRQAPAQTPPLPEEPTRIRIDPSQQGGECPKHGASACSHGTVLHVARQTLKPPRFITYHGTIPMPTSWQTTSGIHRRNPACGRQAPRKSGCAGGVGLSRCRLLVQPAVYQG